MNRWAWPVAAPVVTSRFNPHRKHPVTGVVQPHQGTDFRAPTGTPIYAAAPGTVVYAATLGTAGLAVQIEHGNNIRTCYYHCSKLLVKRGDQVIAGQVIALAGATGRVTGAHLHFEVRRSGVATDPVPWLEDMTRPREDPDPDPEPDPAEDLAPHLERNTLVVIVHTNTAYALISGGRAKKISRSVFDNFKAAGHVPVKLDNALFDEILKDWK